MTNLPAAKSRPPMLLYDGDCGFCATSMETIIRVAAPTATIQPWQSVDLARYQVSQTECDQAVQWIGTDGTRSSGPAALAALLLTGRPRWRPLAWLLAHPPVNWIADHVYRWVARHRHQLPGGTPTCRVSP